MPDPRRLLLEVAQHALRAVDPEPATRTRVAARPPRAPWRLLALGKAAERMAVGALAGAGTTPQAGLVVGIAPRASQSFAPTVVHRRGGHPWPDADSLAAGQAVLDLLGAAGPDDELLVCLSGGASACCEVLPEGLRLTQLVALQRRLLASGAPIAEINRVRSAHSRLKAGRLAALWGERPARVLLVSDVPDGALSALGSGPFLGTTDRDAPLPAADLPSAPWPTQVPAIAHEVLIDNATARRACLTWADRAGVPAFDDGQVLAGDPQQMAAALHALLAVAPSGLHIWGGETSPVLPEHPGRGGRCQHLALAFARLCAGRTDLTLLAFGTDGRDGPGDAAGALVDGDTLARGQDAGLSADDCLRRADSGSFLAAAGDLLDTGPTGSNVADLVLAWKSPPTGVG